MGFQLPVYIIRIFYTVVVTKKYLVTSVKMSAFIYTPRDHTMDCATRMNIVQRKRIVMRDFHDLDYDVLRTRKKNSHDFSPG